MAERNFREMLEERWAKGCFLCVGLDSDAGQIPPQVPGGSVEERIFEFNRAIVDATVEFPGLTPDEKAMMFPDHQQAALFPGVNPDLGPTPLVCAYKPNFAFYAEQGDAGLRALRATVAFIHDRAPGVPVILDGKFGDTSNTNRKYANLAFEYVDADAVTVNPYLGIGSLGHFLMRADRGVFILCRTSNSEAIEFQDLRVGDGEPFYRVVARRVATVWNTHGNCGLVVGATYPRELKDVRAVVGDLPILIPGVGEQGGDVRAAVLAGRDSRNRGIIVNASRSIIFAPPEVGPQIRTVRMWHDIKSALEHGGERNE